MRVSSETANLQPNLEPNETTLGETDLCETNLSGTGNVNVAGLGASDLGLGEFFGFGCWTMILV